MAETYGDSGALFRNDRKANERQPDYTGQATVDGTEYWVSGWIRESKKTKKSYMSLAFTAKDADKQEAEPEAVAAGSDAAPF